MLLGGSTAIAGEYVLTLRAAASGVVDAAGNLLATDAVANWTVDTTAPLGQFAAVVPNPRHTPLTSIGLSFSETVSGLDLADLQLTRNGQAVLLAGSLLTGSGDSYTLDLANFTGAAGEYVLTLGAGGSGIADIAGNALAGDVAVSWTTETTPPTAQFDPVSPNPRRTAVLSLGLSFSEAVSGVDLGDLQLTRNGQPVLLAGNLLTGSGATYRVDLANYTAAGGNYELTLIAGGSGIVDRAGNAIVSSVSVGWTTDVIAPTAQFAPVSPNPRNSPVGLLGLTFSESVTGVDLADFQLLRDGQPVALAGELLAGSGLSYTLDLTNLTAAPGSYVLTLLASGAGIQDGAGNLLTADAARSWTTETTGPTAEFTAVAPNPRNTAVGSIELAFNKPVSGLDLADLLLTRDGEPVALEGASLSGSGANYAIDLASVTAAAGHYVLRLPASGSGNYRRGGKCANRRGHRQLVHRHDRSLGWFRRHYAQSAEYGRGDAQPDIQRARQRSRPGRSAACARRRSRGANRQYSERRRRHLFGRPDKLYRNRRRLHADTPCRGIRHPRRGGEPPRIRCDCHLVHRHIRSHGPVRRRDSQSEKSCRRHAGDFV